MFLYVTGLDDGQATQPRRASERRRTRCARSALADSFGIFHTLLTYHNTSKRHGLFAAIGGTAEASSAIASGRNASITRKPSTARGIIPGQVDTF